jgi:hypothetical protein
MKRKAIIIACGLALTAGALADDTGIPFPEGYRSWYHHRSTVNMPGHQPESNVGIQHVYANALAIEGLKTGKFTDGARDRARSWQ